MELYRFGAGDVVSKKDRHFLWFSTQPAGKTQVESGDLSIYIYGIIPTQL